MKHYWTVVLHFLVAIVLCTGFAVDANAQCKLDDKDCALSGDGYKSSGRFSFVALTPGETAELSLVFYRGLDYQIMLCKGKKLVDLEFKIISSNEEELFNNTFHDMRQEWDFTMTGTQRLRLEVKIPAYAFEGDKTKTGCVEVLIGHRKSDFVEQN